MGVGGALLAFAGAALTVLLQPSDPTSAAMGGIGRGEVMTAIAVICLAISTVISKVSLRQIPLGLFSGFRMLVGTVVFFCATIFLFKAMS